METSSTLLNLQVWQSSILEKSYRLKDSIQRRIYSQLDGSQSESSKVLKIQKRERIIDVKYSRKLEDLDLKSLVKLRILK